MTKPSESAPPGALERALAWAFPRQTRLQRYALLIILLAWWLVFLYLPSGHDLLYYYLPALKGDFVFFYPFWVRWFIQPLAWFAYPYNQWLWVTFTLLTLVFTVRPSTANSFQLFLGFPLVWNLWYGQVETFSAIGLFLIWLGLQKPDYRLLNVGFVLASFKPHITGPAMLLAWLWLPGWRQRLRAIWALAALALVSFIAFGLDWPLQWIDNIGQVPFVEAYSNASLFPWLGWGVLALWLPALLLRLPRQQRFVAVIATTLVTMPYVPVYSQLALYFWAMPWWLWLTGQLVWLQPYTSNIVYSFCVALPLGVLLRLYAPALRALWHARSASIS